MTGYPFRPPWNTPESRSGRPPRPRTEKLPGMLIERDVAVDVAPGEPIYVDVCRPDTQLPAAPLIAWSPYGKHNPAPIGILYPRSGVRPEHTSQITTFEAPDPVYWVPHATSSTSSPGPDTARSCGMAPGRRRGPDLAAFPGRAFCRKRPVSHPAQRYSPKSGDLSAGQACLSQAGRAARRVHLSSSRW